MSIEITRSGLLTTVQDLGRYGFQKYGITVSGAMDAFALRVANLLVGNPESNAVLEMTLIGSSVLFHQDSLISICGANLSPTIDKKSVPMWRPLYVKEGASLDFGQCLKGCRVYIGIAGGLAVPKVLGSRSTYLRANIGGYQGRPLKEKDILHFGAPSNLASKIMSYFSSPLNNHQFRATKWYISPRIFPGYQNNPRVRVIRDRQWDYFTTKSKELFFTQPFQVTNQSDRMGYRLKGPDLQMEKKLVIISEAVTPGTIQVPSDGNPIILLSDRQTTGGYPQIAHIATVDLPVISQVKPGEIIYFEDISLEEAQRLLFLREKIIDQLRKILIHRWEVS